ncbi:TetR/AcrR family transcriptional regulator [Streptomyces sp. ODS28]|uniref:TetR/AcrR family transcriptional regulator n=1 Tax=Streptomyces sp. ODS28 TaxID=3136688 RepID=UPI0031F06F6D
MTSTPRNARSRTRKDPAERRAEILETAARLALERGLERVTMQLVAQELGVRPGLISHYFATIDALLCEAFTRAVTREREALLPGAGQESPEGQEGQEASPARQLSAFLRRIGRKDFADLGRLWLNARHLSRYRPTLREVLAEQEAVMRGVLTRVIEEGVRAGEFDTPDPEGACLVILVVIDGLGAYANDDSGYTHPALDDLLFTTAERELGAGPGVLVREG